MPKYNFNKCCEALLAQYKRRNGKAVARHIRGVCDILRREDDLVVQTKFGGSVRKGTYVTGLSDVDVLLIVNQSTLTNKPPAEVIEYVRDAIQRRYFRNSVTAGKLAVTVGYADKTELQILPAIRAKSGGFRIADPGSTKWSNIVQPERFAEKLAELNSAQDGRVVPVIKLAKAMAGCFTTRPSRKISGYHMESLAVDAFGSYRGSTDSKSMLLHLLGHSMKTVMRPLADSTGQSRYVDEALGLAESPSRKRASTYFEQMRSKVNACTTKVAFDDLFCVGQ